MRPLARTYSWRPVQQTCAAAATVEPTNPSRRRPCGSPARNSCSSPSMNQLARFMAKISMQTNRILPTPRATGLCSRACPAAPPRGSRCIAGFEPETLGGGAPSRSKKKVMRALNVIGPTDGIDQQSLEEYNKLFTRSSYLSDTHMKAIGCSFRLGNTRGCRGDGCCRLAAPSSPLYWSLLACKKQRCLSFPAAPCSLCLVQTSPGWIYQQHEQVEEFWSLGDTDLA